VKILEQHIVTILARIGQYKKHPKKRWILAIPVIVVIVVIISLSLYLKNKAKPTPAIPEVSVLNITPKDSPVTIEFVGQAESSHQVEIRARVNGFLDARVYVEGRKVKANETLFRMDPKPFQAKLDAQKGALAEQEARLATARANLARVKPLVALDALSKKDLDDAIGKEQEAMAAVETAMANVYQAELNLGYTNIYSPITGFSSYARVQDGTFISPENSLLTYVYQTDPIWVNFSVSENDALKYRGASNRGLFRVPKNNAYEVEVLLADGSLYPEKGQITFADAEYSQQTGTFLVRATLANPDDLLRPGQFLRVRLQGGIRPDAILVPQKAVFEGAHGNFVWVVDKEDLAQIRTVEIGPVYQDKWFIDKGLHAGDKVIIEGMMKIVQGMKVKSVMLEKPDNALKGPDDAFQHLGAKS
jgi:membrane fusion protein (multidrug efflux system)